MLRGEKTSDVEVTNVSQHGFWIFIGDGELFASFADFPWFEQASIKELTTVERPSPVRRKQATGLASLTHPGCR